jgi:hypothetical protein
MKQGQDRVVANNNGPDGYDALLHGTVNTFRRILNIHHLQLRTGSLIYVRHVRGVSASLMYEHVGTRECPMGQWGIHWLII